MDSDSLSDLKGPPMGYMGSQFNFWTKIGLWSQCVTRIREKVYTCAPLLVPLVIFLVFDNNFTLLRSLLFLLHPEKMCDSDRLKIRDISLQGWSTNKILL